MKALLFSMRLDALEAVSSRAEGAGLKGKSIALEGEVA